MGAQIITTEATVLKLDADLQEMCRQFDKTSVKGKEEEIIIHQVDWEASDDVTRIEISSDTIQEQVMYLSLEFQGIATRLASDDHRVFVMGRG